MIGLATHGRRTGRGSGLLALIAAIALLLPSIATAQNPCIPGGYGNPGPAPSPGPGPAPAPAPNPAPRGGGGGVTGPPAGGGTTGPVGPTGPTTSPAGPTGPVGGGGGNGGVTGAPAGGGGPTGSPVGGGRTSPGLPTRPTGGGGFTGGGGVGGPQGTGGFGRGTPGARPKPKSAPSQEGWEYWWHYNKWEWMALRAASLRGGASRSGDTWLGSGDGDLRQSGRLLGEAVVEERVLPTLRRALSDSYARNRATALFALAKTGHASCVPDLISAIARTSGEEQEAALLGLGLLGRPETVPLLSEIVRESAAGRRAVGELNGSSVPERLRQIAILSLGMTRAPEARDALAEALGDRRDDTAACAAAALGLLGESSAAPLLLQTLARQNSGRVVRAAAAAALGKLGDSSTPVVEALLGALQGRDRDLQIAAAGALGKLAPRGNAEVIKALTRESLTGGQGVQSGYAVIALARVDGGVAREVARKLLAQGGTTGGYAALALAIAGREIGRDEAIQDLSRVVQKASDVSVRAAALIGLGLLGAGDAEDIVLRRAEKAKNPMVQRAAVTAIGLAAIEGGADLLKKLLQEKDPQTVHEAALALALVGEGQEAVQDLILRLRSANGDYERAACAQALGLIGAPMSVEALAQIAIGVDSPTGARGYASSALGLLADEREVPLLFGFRSNSSLYLLNIPALTKLMVVL